MDENYVVKEHLTDAMIDAGARLTQRLLDSGFPLDAAFWLWDPEISDDWQMVVAASRHVLHRPRDGFGEILSVVRELDEDAKAIVRRVTRPTNSDSELVRAIRAEYPTGDNIVRKRLKRHAPNGKYIHDALLYRAV